MDACACTLKMQFGIIFSFYILKFKFRINICIEHIYNTPSAKLGNGSINLVFFLNVDVEGRLYGNKMENCDK